MEINKISENSKNMSSIHTCKKYGVVISLAPNGSSENTDVFYPSVILDGNTYKMWHSGSDGNHDRIYYVTSTDGITWDKQGVVVPLGDSGSGVSYIDSPTVIKDGNTYKMWYTSTFDLRYRIFYATSTDGITWDKHGIALDYGYKGDGDSWHTYSSSVIKDGNTYKMWYSGYDGRNTRILYATSDDGITWNKHGVVVPLGDSGSTDDEYINYPSVIKDGNIYKMWYTGNYNIHGRIHYATSTDGITWDKHGVVVPLGVSGSSDSYHTHAPAVIKDNDIYKMWYSGFDGSHSRIHYAELHDKK